MIAIAGSSPAMTATGMMSMLILAGISLYALVGLVTALAFVTMGVTRVLPHPAPVTVGARILLIPAAAALWPYVLYRWRNADHAAMRHAQ
jgi:hypothetical protein